MTYAHVSSSWSTSRVFQREKKRIVFLYNLMMQSRKPYTDRKRVISRGRTIGTVRHRIKRVSARDVPWCPSSLLHFKTVLMSLHPTGVSPIEQVVASPVWSSETGSWVRGDVVRPWVESDRSWTYHNGDGQKIFCSLWGTLRCLFTNKKNLNENRSPFPITTTELLFPWSLLLGWFKQLL